MKSVLFVLDDRIHDAITFLRQENLKDSNDPKIQADLAAVYISKGDADGQYYDYIQALEFASSAVQLDPLLPVASFNLALALERSYLLSQAQAEWKRYLILDTSSPWRAEALTHFRSLQTLQENALRPQQYSFEFMRKEVSARALEAHIRQKPALGEAIRVYAEETLFASWATSQLQGNPEKARRDLDSLRTIGAVLLHLYGDRFLADSVQAIDASWRSENLNRLHELVKGHEFFVQASMLFADGKEAAAYINFNKAAKLLKAGGSSFWFAATINAANSALYAGQPEYSVKLIDSVDVGLSNMPFLALRGRAYWVRGVARLRLSDLLGARSSYMEALSLFEQVHEPTNIGALHCLIAESLRFQGDPSEAWQERHEALKNSLNSPLWFHNSIFDGAESLLREHKPEVALRFQSELLTSLLCPQDPISRLEAFIRRARSYLAVGNRRAAICDIRSASKLLTLVSSFPRRLPLEADISMVKGESCLGLNPSCGLDFLTRSIGYYKNHNRIFRLPELLQKRARSLIALNRLQEAETDLGLGIHEVGAQYQELVTNPLREDYRVQSRELFEEAIGFQVKIQKNGVKAFCWAEISRQRYQGGSRPLCHLDASPLEPNLGRFRKNIPSNTTVVGYYLLDDQLLIWILSRDFYKFVEVPVKREHLRELVGEFIRSASGGEKSLRFQELDQKISTVLLPERIRDYKANRRIVFVPDSFLFGLPFAALVDHSDIFLASKHIVSISPSFSFIINGRVAKKEKNFNILAIGDPAFDRKEMADLPGLSSSRLEISEIKSLFPTATLLTGRAATRGNVLSLLPRYGIVHISSHTSVNGDYPLLSFIALAGYHGPESSGSLYARDIYNLDLKNVRLVVVATCDSAKGLILGGEGAAYFAQAFLSAGSAAVIGSLWRVRDDDSRSFFRDFYQRMKLGSDVFTAMQGAQAHFMGNDRPESKSLAWAGFTIIGGT